MSMHTEWDVAKTCAIGAASREEANDEWSLGEEVTAPYVLVLGGDGGGCLAVEGTREELIAFADRVRRAVGTLAGCDHSPAALRVIEMSRCECGELIRPAD